MKPTIDPISTPTRFAIPIIAALAALLLTSLPAIAGVTAATPELQVNLFTTGAQQAPAVTVDGAGNFIVVWMSDGQDGDGQGVFVQRYDAAGSPIGMPAAVNSYTTGAQQYPSVAADGGGGFVVAWESELNDGDGYGIGARRFGSDGLPLAADFQANTYTTSYQLVPRVGSDAGGDFVVVWSSLGQDGDYSGVFGQRYDSTGAPAGTEFRVNSYTTADQYLPAVSVNDAGDFVVVWHSSGQDGSADGIFGQRYDSTGAPQGTEFLANAATLGAQRSAAVALDSAGRFVVAWTTYDTTKDGDGSSVRAQRFDAAGAPAGTEFQVNVYTTGAQRTPSVAVADDGGFVVTWRSNAQDGDSGGIFARRFMSDGTPRGSEFQVNTYTTGLQRLASVASDGDGNLLVTWQSDGEDGDATGVFAQPYFQCVDATLPASLSCYLGKDCNVPVTLAADGVAVAGVASEIASTADLSCNDTCMTGAASQNGTCYSDAATCTFTVLDVAAPVTPFGDGVVANVPVTCDSVSTGDVCLSNPTAARTGGTPMPVCTEDCTPVTCSQCEPGNCNGLGTVDAGDPVCSVLCLINQPGEDADCECAADCNCLAGLEASDPVCTVLRLVGLFDPDTCTPGAPPFIAQAPDYGARLIMGKSRTSKSGARTRNAIKLRGSAAADVSALRAWLESPGGTIARVGLTRRARAEGFTLEVGGDGGAVLVAVTPPVTTPIPTLDRGPVLRVVVRGGDGQLTIARDEFGSLRGLPIPSLH